MTSRGLSLADNLKQSIRSSGPITFRDWMEAALYDPEQGYYTSSSRTPWGREGDYRTSPERSRLFAATLARYFLNLRERMGGPLTVVEAGAGGGFFAANVLESLRRMEPAQSIRYIVDERGEAAREKLRDRLGSEITFASIDEIEPCAGIFFANELLDAFPVHRITRHDDKWYELYVELDREGEFKFVTGPLSSSRLERYFERLELLPANSHVADVNLEIEDWLQMVQKKLAQGFLVLVDYGAEAVELFESPLRRDGTLRAFQQHSMPANPLANPGRQDLTTTIDWTTVRLVAETLGFRVEEFDRQDKFLMRHGFVEELERQSSSLQSEADRAVLNAEAKEMLLPSGMSASFQVMVLSRNLA